MHIVESLTLSRTDAVHQEGSYEENESTRTHTAIDSVYRLDLFCMLVQFNLQKRGEMLPE